MNYRNITKIVRNMKLFKNKFNISSELNENEFEFVRYLTKHPEGLSQNDIATHLNVDKALVTRMVKKIQKLGYISVEKDNSDSRKNVLKATQKASTIKHEIETDEILYYEKITSVLTEEEKMIFDHLIEKVYLESKKQRKTNFKDFSGEKKLQ